MPDVATFRARVHELTRRSTPYDGRRPTQKDLAAAIGLTPSELSRRLHRAGGVVLTARDVRAIVRTLADWGALTTQAEAAELLALVDCPSFSPAEWQAPPLDLLTPPAPRSPPAVAVPPLLTQPPLPVPQTRCIGRDAEVAALTDRLRTTRLVTLTGTGGCGKTRLALEVAVRLQQERATEVRWIALEALRDPLHVPALVARRLGVIEQAGQDVVTTLCTVLGSQPLVLVLDNCEHLLPAVVPLVQQLLRHCPALRVLTTSRHLLHLPGEVIWRVPALALPPPETPATPAAVAAFAAIQLFVDRVQAVDPLFTLTVANVAAVRDICQQLDGIPLAIELAAARLRVLTVAEIRAHLADRFALLTGGSPLLLPRQQTLQALVAWSYDLLTPAEQHLFAHLSLFAGGATWAAAVAVTAPREQAGVLDGLTALLDKSLLHRGPGLADEARFTMLETIRLYARERLHAQGAEAVARARHLDYYQTLAAQAALGLQGSDQARWLARLEAEYPNLGQALEWALAHQAADPALHLGMAVARLAQVRNYLREGYQWLARALVLGPVGDPALHSAAQAYAGQLSWRLGEYAAAQAHFTTALTVAQAASDAVSQARAYLGLGLLAYSQGDYRAARTRQVTSLHWFRAAHNQPGIAWTLYQLGLIFLAQGRYGLAQGLLQQSWHRQTAAGYGSGVAAAGNALGMVAAAQGDYALAQTWYEQSLALQVSLGDTQSQAAVLNNLGNIARKRGDTAEAAARYTASLALRQAAGDRRGLAFILHNLGTLLQDQGRYEAAADYYQASLRHRRALGDQSGCAESFEGLASLAVAEGQPERAAQLFGAAEALRTALAAPLPPRERAAYERDQGALGTQLTPTELAASWAQGQALTLEQAIALALTRVMPDPSNPAAVVATPAAAEATPLSIP